MNGGQSCRRGAFGCGANDRGEANHALPKLGPYTAHFPIVAVNNSSQNLEQRKDNYPVSIIINNNNNIIIMKFQAIFAFLFAMIIGATMMVVDASNVRGGGGDPKAAICKQVKPGLYMKRMVKKARIVHMTGPGTNAVAGRCGPETCKMLCEGAMGHESTGAGEKCVCKY
jgi:hypothetical protein